MGLKSSQNLLESTTSPLSQKTSEKVLDALEVKPTFEHKKLLTWILLHPVLLLLSVWARGKKAWWRKFIGKEPPVNSMWCDGLGYCWSQIRSGKGSWRALEIIYNINDYVGNNCHKIGKHLDLLYSKNNHNPKAVRNRLKISKIILENLIQNYKTGQMRILCLACGSAQAVIESVAMHPDRDIKVLLVDIDAQALEYAKSLAAKHGVLDRFEFQQRNAMLVAKIAKDFKPHLIEMLGLLDYIPKDLAISLADRIRKSLEPGGVFITCNIHPNPEIPIVRWILNWEMIYRTKQEIIDIIKGGGFGEYELITEPLGIHSIVVASRRIEG